MQTMDFVFNSQTLITVVHQKSRLIIMAKHYLDFQAYFVF